MDNQNLNGKDVAGNAVRKFRTQGQKTSASDVDVMVGKKLRIARLAEGMNQATFSAHLGISCQQLQKYETAINKIAIKVLIDASKILGIPLIFFLGDFTDNNYQGAGNTVYRVSEKWSPIQDKPVEDIDIMDSMQYIKGSKKILRNLKIISEKSPSTMRHLVGLIEHLSGMNDA